MAPKSDSCEEIVLHFANEQNKPLNSQIAADCLEKFNLKQTAVQKALDTLADSGKITFNEYGKRKIYLAPRDQFDTLNAEEQMSEAEAEVDADVEAVSEAGGEAEAVSEDDGEAEADGEANANANAGGQVLGDEGGDMIDMDAYDNFDEEEQDGNCVLCVHLPKRYALYRCGHYGYCRPCIDKLLERGSCPNDRRPIAGWFALIHDWRRDYFLIQHMQHDFKKLCQTCQNPDREMRAFYPCGHMARCEFCLPLDLFCPICSCPYVEAIRIFRP